MPRKNQREGDASPTDEAMESADAFTAWAAEPDVRGGQRCLTCTEYPNLLEDIRKFLRLKASGELKKTYSSFWKRYLCKQRGYALSETALQNHLRNCEAELFAKVRGRE